MTLDVMQCYDLLYYDYVMMYYDLCYAMICHAHHVNIIVFEIVRSCYAKNVSMKMFMKDECTICILYDLKLRGPHAFLGVNTHWDTSPL